MEAICSVAGCDRPVNARDFCKRHYYRWSRYGDPLGQPGPRAPRPPKVKPPCSVEDCERPAYGKGLCEPHYARQRRHGSLHDKRAEARDPGVRFWERVEKTPTCWLWTGPPNGAGYGYFNLDGRVVGAHVAVLLLAGVKVPKGYEPDHLCRVPLCVRPSHLEVVTAAENRRRAALRANTQVVTVIECPVCGTRLPPEFMDRHGEVAGYGKLHGTALTNPQT